MRIWIGEESDGFEICLMNNDGAIIKAVRVNQEESVEQLTEIFEFMGYKTDFEEIY